MKARDALRMWVIYDHPRDCDAFIARLWTMRCWQFDKAVMKPTNETITSQSLEFIRDAMRNSDLTCLARQENDDPCIVEVWL